MVKIENNMGGCIVSGRKLKYGEGIMRIPYKGTPLHTFTLTFTPTIVYITGIRKGV